MTCSTSVVSDACTCGVGWCTTGPIPPCPVHDKGWVPCTCKGLRLDDMPCPRHGPFNTRVPEPEPKSIGAVELEKIVQKMREMQSSSIPTGWRCPVCSRVMAPGMPNCTGCGPKEKKA